MRLFIIGFVFIIFSCKNKESLDSSITSDNIEIEETVLESVASAYGIENWSRIEEINFSFVVNPGDNESVRTWKWLPKTGDVTLFQNENEITYNQNNVKENQKQYDRLFVNDSFWLTFPFHMVWDDIEFSVEENMISPIEAVECDKIIVKYPTEGGYTPGDRYDVYINDKFHIIEWSYYPNGADKPRLTNTFEDLSEFNGIKTNLVFRNPELGFQLVLRDVSFK